MTLKRTDAIDLEIIDEKYQTKRMLTLAKKEFRNKHIVEATMILHSAIEQHLFVAWSIVIMLKFDLTNPFDKLKDKNTMYQGFKELAYVLYQIDLINKENLKKKLSEKLQFLF